ncbi:Gfo/Idh/MocA family oxidoreductase [Flavobacteriaceae bacterium]|nr:Gfo/Idh/MocA family oxidoreductase [Flavobacteriaceae bacterium]
MKMIINTSREMITECLRAKIRLFVIKKNRYNLPIIKLKRKTDSGRFGKLFMATVTVSWDLTQYYYDQYNWRETWETDGYVITNQASHHIDLLQWFMGKVELVYAKGIRALSDIEAVVFKFHNGDIGLLNTITIIRLKDLENLISRIN